MKRINEAIAVLVDYVDHFPVDVEAWVELAELYQSQGMFSQAIFSLEEALLITPNAWNVSGTRRGSPYDGLKLHTASRSSGRTQLYGSSRINGWVGKCAQSAE